MNTQTDNEPKSFREQLEILKNRGMVIEDDQIALKYLQNVNYYKISGYTYFFRDTQSINIEKFKSNTSLSQIINIINKDEALRAVMLKSILRIENSFKCKLAYELSMSDLGRLGYLERKKETYLNLEHFDLFIATLNKRKKQMKHTKYIKHYNEKYNGFLPLWVAIEILSFGETSMLYRNLRPKYKGLITKYFFLEYEVLYSWISTVSAIRNMCAHNDRLYKNTVKSAPRQVDGLYIDSSMASGIKIITCLSDDISRLEFIKEINDLRKPSATAFKTAYRLSNNWDKKVNSFLASRNNKPAK